MQELRLQRAMISELKSQVDRQQQAAVDMGFKLTPCRGGHNPISHTAREVSVTGSWPWLRRNEPLASSSTQLQPNLEA